MLRDFKQAVKDSLLQLTQMEVKLNDKSGAVRKKAKNLKQRTLEEETLLCERTFALVRDQFGVDSAFTKQFITHELDAQPFEQYHFIRTLVVSMNREITDTIRDSIYMKERKKMAEYYQELLVMFTRHMCDYDREQVEFWVEKDYFPTKQCIEICRDKKNLSAEAKLLEKMNDCKAAIQIYLEVISKINPKRMSDQLLMVKRDDCAWGGLT